MGVFVLLVCTSFYKKVKQGLPFSFPEGGGMVPPLRGGTQGGGMSHRGGGMTRDTNATNKHNNFVYQEDILE